jgi:branched-chain amino acid transport system substrate-binding protein
LGIDRIGGFLLHRHCCRRPFCSEVGRKEISTLTTMKKIWLSILSGLLCLNLLLAIAGCGKQTPPSGKNSLEIGSVLPLTGSAAVWGQNAKMGMDLAASEINAKGGINGHPISVLYQDSQSEPSVATSALQQLISVHHIQVVIGDIASSSVLAMAPIAQKNQVVLLSPGASNPDISKAGDFIFRNWQSDALEGEVDAQYAYSKQGWEKRSTRSRVGDFRLVLG